MWLIKATLTSSSNSRKHSGQSSLAVVLRPFADGKRGAVACLG